MGILRTASSDVKKIMLDETDYIEVRAEISKREFNYLASRMPTNVGESGENLSLADATAFQKFLFEELVVGWSLPVAVSGEAYETLNAEAAQAVDEKVAEHFEALLPSTDESKKPST